MRPIYGSDFMLHIFAITSPSGGVHNVACNFRNLPAKPCIFSHTTPIWFAHGGSFLEDRAWPASSQPFARGPRAAAARARPSHVPARAGVIDGIFQQHFQY